MQNDSELISHFELFQREVSHRPLADLARMRAARQNRKSEIENTWFGICSPRSEVTSLTHRIEPVIV